MQRYLRPLLYALAGSAIAAAAGWLFLGSPHVRYQHLRIVGASRAPVAELRHLADLPLGEPLVALDLEAAAHGVSRHPWVESAEVRRSFPDTVVIVVRERVPVAVAQVGGLFLVDASGELFVRARPGDFDHPYLTGIGAELAEQQPEVARRVVREGLAWLEVLQGQGGLAEREISELNFNAQVGYTLVLRGGAEVILGFASPERAARLPLLARQGVNLARPQRIDLASDRLAVVTPL